jgi:hypothetical protein
MLGEMGIEWRGPYRLGRGRRDEHIADTKFEGPTAGAGP